MLGIISGTISLQKVKIFQNHQKITKATEFGNVNLFISDSHALISRHGEDPQKHILPHLINHRANMKVFCNLGITEIISINSTGSLKINLEPGALVVPDDFIMLSSYPSLTDDRTRHITPGLDSEVRKRFLAAAADAHVDVVGDGVYWQTQGPRLETRAEIRMMAQFADLVGMTMASEAIVAQEAGLRYGALCSVDNFAHGIGSQELTLAEITAHGLRNTERIASIIEMYLKRCEMA